MVILIGKRPGASTLLAQSREEPSAIFLIFRIPRGTKWWENTLHQGTGSAIKAENGTSLEVTWKVMLETAVRERIVFFWEVQIFFFLIQGLKCYWEVFIIKLLINGRIYMALSCLR